MLLLLLLLVLLLLLLLLLLLVATIDVTQLRQQVLSGSQMCAENVKFKLASITLPVVGLFFLSSLLLLLLAGLQLATYAGSTFESRKPTTTKEPQKLFGFISFVWPSLQLCLCAFAVVASLCLLGRQCAECELCARLLLLSSAAVLYGTSENNKQRAQLKTMQCTTAPPPSSLTNSNHAIVQSFPCVHLYSSYQSLSLKN